MDLLAERAIPLELCPTSNLQTSTVASWEDHPLPRFLDRGLTVTLSTDDPSISGIDLAHEYRTVQDHLGLTEADCHTLQRNALEAAFLTEGERRALLALQTPEDPS
jgi:adenosine deaminase